MENQMSSFLFSNKNEEIGQFLANVNNECVIEKEINQSHYVDMLEFQGEDLEQNYWHCEEPEDFFVKELEFDEKEIKNGKIMEDIEDFSNFYNESTQENERFLSKKRNLKAKKNEKVSNKTKKKTKFQFLD